MSHVAKDVLYEIEEDETEPLCKSCGEPVFGDHEVCFGCYHEHQFLQAEWRRDSLENR